MFYSDVIVISTSYPAPAGISIERRQAGAAFLPSWIADRSRRSVRCLREDRRPPISCVSCRRSLNIGNSSVMSHAGVICVWHMLIVHERQKRSIAANSVCNSYVLRVWGSFQVYASALGERPVRSDDTLRSDKFYCLFIAVIRHVLLRVSCFTACDAPW